MYWLDTTIVIIVAAGAIFGALSGLLLQLARLVGFAVALYAAIVFNDQATTLLQQGFAQDAEPWVTRVLAYVLVFLAVYLTIFVLTVVLERGVKAARLQALNRLLGALLGAAKFGLVLGAVFLGVTQFPTGATREMMDRSTLAPVLARGTEQLVTALAGEYRDELRGGLDGLTRALRSELPELPYDPDDLELP
jgi:uncharacterized membrane protein required for colicin V production